MKKLKKDTGNTEVEVEDKKASSKGLFSWISRLLKGIFRLLLNNKYQIDELIHIARPVIYVYSVLKYGKNSYRPLKISLALDLVQTLFSLLRLWRHRVR